MHLIGALIGLILFLVIVGVVFWAIRTVLALIPLPEPFGTLIYVALVVVAALICIYVIVWLLGIVGVHVPIPTGR